MGSISKLNKFLLVFSFIIGGFALAIGSFIIYAVIREVMDGHNFEIRGFIFLLMGMIFLIGGGIFIFDKIRVDSGESPSPSPDSEQLDSEKD